MAIPQKGFGPNPNLKLVIHAAKEFLEEWDAFLWQENPSRIVILPFPNGVFMAFDSADGTEKRAVYLAAEDAHLVGERLVVHAAEATRLGGQK